MRILIYSETDAAKARRDELRADGHHASLRNPDLFNPLDFDKRVDGIVADSAVILDAYKAIGIKTALLMEAEPELAPTPDAPGDDASAAELESLTVAQLREMAEARGLELKSSLTKAAIIEALQQAS